MSAAAVPDVVRDGCHYLRTVAGLPCHIDEYGRLAVVIGGNVRAVIMNEFWGYRVKATLTGVGIAVPIIEYPLRRLTFLTGLYDPIECATKFSALLSETESVLVAEGHILTLPTPGDDSRRWDAPAHNYFRPPAASVLAALAAARPDLP